MDQFSCDMCSKDKLLTSSKVRRRTDGKLPFNVNNISITCKPISRNEWLKFNHSFKQKKNQDGEWKLFKCWFSPLNLLYYLQAWSLHYLSSFNKELWKKRKTNWRCNWIMTAARDKLSLHSEVLWGCLVNFESHCLIVVISAT